MNFKMKIANLLAESINGFVQFVMDTHDSNSSFILNPDKLYQIKLFAEEFKLQIVADELQRINQYGWNEKYTHLLVERFRKGLDVIDEYVERNYDDLFIFTARLHTLKSLSSLLRKEE
ncbi:hypothetical protein D0469_13870 [Peribacillus saganii]|uniref:Uncharacterized protein n=1 Tax=Peribacillus saganii TaxID=2303992 RepID=A0A372LM65_9BACI|nr:hypothetical protein [Peribacillus saganii]RFU67631.1 hypothetical protein D0469_13870 [Peribacillus saganii]